MEGHRILVDISIIEFHLVIIVLRQKRRPFLLYDYTSRKRYNNSECCNCRFTVYTSKNRQSSNQYEETK